MNRKLIFDNYYYCKLTTSRMHIWWTRYVVVAWYTVNSSLVAISAHPLAVLKCWYCKRRALHGVRCEKCVWWDEPTVQVISLLPQGFLYSVEAHPQHPGGRPTFQHDSLAACSGPLKTILCISFRFCVMMCPESHTQTLIMIMALCTGGLGIRLWPNTVECFMVDHTATELRTHQCSIANTHPVVHSCRSFDKLPCRDHGISWSHSQGCVPAHGLGAGASVLLQDHADGQANKSNEDSIPIFSLSLVSYPDLLPVLGIWDE